MVQYLEFSTLLVRYLNERDRTSAWLARRLNVHSSTVSRWIHDAARPSSPEVVGQIADILGVYDVRERGELMSAAGYAIVENGNSPFENRQFHINRGQISNVYSPREHSENSALFPTLNEDVRSALRQWHAKSSDPSPLHYLYLLRKVDDTARRHPQKATNRLLHQALELLEKNCDADSAKLLRLRFLDKEKAHSVANQLNVADSTVYSLQKEAIEQLAGIIREMEAEARKEQRAMLGERLEAAIYVNLVGMEQHLAHLSNLVGTSGSPYLIALEGLGGIGKTSLADALMRQIINESVVDDIGWVTVRHSYLNMGGGIEAVSTPLITGEAVVDALVKQLLADVVGTAGFPLERKLSILEAHLKERPHIIVVDNLETLADVRDLMPTLQRLANPSKFIITSRERLHCEPNIYHFIVPELSQAHTVQLLRQEADLSNLSLLSESPDEVLQPIVDTIGGNPLAIRLVVGQLHIHSVDVVLADLAEVRGEPVENLYTFIYRRAWDSLDELSREVLLAMPLVHEGGEDLAFLGQVANLSDGDLRKGLNKLVTLNLVNVHGDLHSRRYNIHSLTRTFLYRQVVLWENPPT
ncbi:MAG: NB-ARC domain-containing protein [Chloroflexota bacterium]